MERVRRFIYWFKNLFGIRKSSVVHDDIEAC